MMLNSAPLSLNRGPMNPLPPNIKLMTRDIKRLNPLSQEASDNLNSKSSEVRKDINETLKN